VVSGKIECLPCSIMDQYQKAIKGVDIMLWHSSGLHNNISIISKIQTQFTRNLHASRIQKNIYNHTRYQRSSP
jgi:hypothetical protein